MFHRIGQDLARQARGDHRTPVVTCGCTCPSSRRSFEPMAIAALVDGTTDALADLRADTDRAQQARAAAADDAVTTSIMAVVPVTIVLGGHNMQIRQRPVRMIRQRSTTCAI